MIPYTEALAIVQKHAHPLGTEKRALAELFGHVLWEPTTAPHDLPLFANSAVDGFGVRFSDVSKASNESPTVLKNLGTIQAGQAGDFSLATLTEGSAVKILTGAPIPAGVEAVVMQEFTTSQNGSVSVQRPVKAGENIRWQGEEFAKGDEVLPADTLVTPPVAGLLASLGYTEANVYKKPRVAIVITGNELVQPGQALSPGQIYESNSQSLIAALKALHNEPVAVYHVGDSLESTQEVLSRALAESDILISTGGVSVGEFDWVKDAASTLDIETRFWKVAIKPGKPVFFGTQGQKLIFGLPGNPVAVLLTFLLFVRPALQKMQGLPVTADIQYRARLLKDLRKKPDRLDFVRGRLSMDASGWTVMPTTGQGSHMLGGLAQADCLIPFERDAAHLAAGSHVDILPLDWRLNA